MHVQGIHTTSNEVSWLQSGGHRAYAWWCCSASPIYVVVAVVGLAYNYAAYASVCVCVCVSRVCAVFVLSLRFMSERARKKYIKTTTTMMKNLVFIFFSFLFLRQFCYCCCCFMLRVFITRRRCGRTKHTTQNRTEQDVVARLLSLSLLFLLSSSSPPLVVHVVAVVVVALASMLEILCDAFVGMSKMQKRNTNTTTLRLRCLPLLA